MKCTNEQGDELYGQSGTWSLQPTNYTFAEYGGGTPHQRHSKQFWTQPPPETTGSAS